MEQKLYENIVSFIRNGRSFNKKATSLPNFSASYWEKAFANITIGPDDRLLLGNYYIPTFTQATDCLKLAHKMGSKTLHCINEERLSDALLADRYLCPAFIGGQTRVVKE